MSKTGVYKHQQFGIRIPIDKIEKLKIIAEHNARSANKEIEIIITKHIEQFEEDHGVIKLDKENPL